MRLIAREPAKFTNPQITLDGSRRARVTATRLDTLWFNTGTLCNLTCESCYIESSPSNDRLVYLSRAEAAAFFTELEALGHGAHTIGFTGGEPFMNPEFPGMLEDALQAGYRALVLTNAMKPMFKCRTPLLELQRRFGSALVIRVSMDHYQRTLHEQERGPRSWTPMLEGLRWLCANGFTVHVAGRTRWGADEAELRAGYGALFAAEDLTIDSADPEALVLFPEMDAQQDVPEITEACWDILGVHPDSVMCASSRMVVKRRGAEKPVVVACTLLPYDPRFELGGTLAESLRPVALNHPHCARFCVLGGGSCGR